MSDFKLEKICKANTHFNAKPTPKTFKYIVLKTKKTSSIIEVLLYSLNKSKKELSENNVNILLNRCTNILERFSSMNYIDLELMGISDDDDSNSSTYSVNTMYNETLTEINQIVKENTEGCIFLKVPDEIDEFHFYKLFESEIREIVEKYSDISDIVYVEKYDNVLFVKLE